MTFKTHYEPVPVTEKPEADGWYFVFNPHNPSDSNFCQFKDGVWQHKNAAFTHYIRPRPDTVLLTREEVERGDLGNDFALWLVVNKWEYDHDSHTWFNNYITEFHGLNLRYEKLVKVYRKEPLQ